jgi:glucose/mannose-6-phosphate isomerase
MRNLILNFPSQIEKTLESLSQQEFKAELGSTQNIVIAGMGGSGIAGKVLSQVYGSTLKYPINFATGYTIPGFVNQNTLFIACSYSGNTEETLIMVKAAQEKGAKIACMSSGGQLANLAQKNNWPIFFIEGGHPPRSQFGAAFSGLLSIFCKFGLIDNAEINALKQVAKVLKEKQSSLEDNAAIIAHELVENIPVIYAPNHFEAVALRLRQQINENSKMLCWHAVIPEMNHNEIVGWELADEFLKLIMIRDEVESNSMETRCEITQDIASEQADVMEIRPEGSTLLEQTFYLIHFFDFVSLHLANLNHVDPIAIRNIDTLKAALLKNK